MTHRKYKGSSRDSSLPTLTELANDGSSRLGLPRRPLPARPLHHLRGWMEAGTVGGGHKSRRVQHSVLSALATSHSGRTLDTCKFRRVPGTVQTLSVSLPDPCKRDESWETGSPVTQLLGYNIHSVSESHFGIANSQCSLPTHAPPPAPLRTYTC